MRKPVGVIGGPPCQAFSMSNRNGGSRDARANLPENYAAVLKELATAFELDFFVFENVLGLRYKKHSELSVRSRNYSLLQDSQSLKGNSTRKISARRKYASGFLSWDLTRRNIQILSSNFPLAPQRLRERFKMRSGRCRNPNACGQATRIVRIGGPSRVENCV
jgi:site-specific DNA-cytosine methylase